MVSFHGPISDIRNILASADCMLIPSLWEAFPLVALEAGAMKIPIIANPVGSLPSILNNKNGYLSSLEDFQNTMMVVMNNYPDAIKRAERFKKVVKHKYCIRKVVRKYESLYNSL